MTRAGRETPATRGSNVPKREPFSGGRRERRRQAAPEAAYLKTGGASSSGRSGSGTSIRTVLGSTPVPLSIQ